jgi:hypothetical protein
MGDILGKHGETVTKKPAPEKTITIVLKYNYRLAVYCADKCLGSFEWSSEETVEVTPTWKEFTNSITQATSWTLEYVGKRTKNPPVTIGAWKPGPC